jgi:hypothetical protein
MSGLKDGIHRAETEEEKRAVYRFRYAAARYSSITARSPITVASIRLKCGSK